jgi:Fur family peroxide stress response transcriptional regulator
MTDRPYLEKLRDSGLRITPQRVAICDLLIASETHPTATDIYSQLKPHYPSLSLATVYNTLDVLVGVGMVNALGSVGDDRVHFDANLSPHINLTCVKCHKIVDTHSDCADGLDVEVAQKTGFQISGSSLVYFGVCPQCLKRSQPRRTSLITESI